jgi:hypothetical protein
MLPGVLRDFLNFAVLDAGGANVEMFVACFCNSPNALKIEVPAAFGYVMGVADAVTELRATTA